MIGRPSTARLLEVIRHELRDSIGPKLGDDPAAASLHMIDHILDTLARRAAHEVAWMVEETAALTAFGEQAVADLGPGSRTAAALDARRAPVPARSTSPTSRPATRSPARCSRVPSRRPSPSSLAERRRRRRSTRA